MKSIKMLGNDLDFQRGDFLMIDGTQEVAQSLQSLLSIRLGEFKLDELVGLYRDNILGKNRNRDEMKDDIIECLSIDDRVELVNDIQINVLSNREAVILFSVRLVSGEDIEGEVRMDA